MPKDVGMHRQSQKPAWRDGAKSQPSGSDAQIQSRPTRSGVTDGPQRILAGGQKGTHVGGLKDALGDVKGEALLRLAAKSRDFVRDPPPRPTQAQMVAGRKPSMSSSDSKRSKTTPGCFLDDRCRKKKRLKR